MDKKHYYIDFRLARRANVRWPTQKNQLQL